MKKVLALILALSMAFALCACGDDEPENTNENDVVADAPVVEEENPVKKYFDENGEAFLSSMTESFNSSSGGQTCKGYLEVEGKGVIVDVCITGLNDVADELKAQFRESYDAIGSSFDSVLALLQTEVPELESLTLNVCEEDRDILATIKVGK